MILHALYWLVTECNRKQTGRGNCFTGRESCVLCPPGSSLEHGTYPFSDVFFVETRIRAERSFFVTRRIAKTFEFASNRNKAFTGPLPRFAQMIHIGYPVLLNAQNFTLLSALQLGPTEYVVRVEICGRLRMGNERIVPWSTFREFFRVQPLRVQDHQNRMS